LTSKDQKDGFHRPLFALIKCNEKNKTIVENIK